MDHRQGGLRIDHEPQGLGVHRDTFKKMTCSGEDEEGLKWEMKFEITEEPNLWKIIGSRVEGMDLVEKHMGFMSIYVDDVLMTAKKEVIIAAVRCIEKEWALSPGMAIGRRAVEVITAVLRCGKLRMALT